MPRRRGRLQALANAVERRRELASSGLRSGARAGEHAMHQLIELPAHPCLRCLDNQVLKLRRKARTRFCTLSTVRPVAAAVSEADMPSSKAQANTSRRWSSSVSR